MNTRLNSAPSRMPAGRALPRAAEGQKSERRVHRKKQIRVAGLKKVIQPQGHALVALFSAVVGGREPKRHVLKREEVCSSSRVETALTPARLTWWPSWSRI